MDKLIITCNPNNLPSRRTCENAGLKLKEIVDLPSYNDMYKDGERQECILGLCFGFGEDGSNDYMCGIEWENIRASA